MYSLKRLVRKAFRIGSAVRFINTEHGDGTFTIIKVNKDGTYNVVNANGDGIDNVSSGELTDSKEFIVGDKVRFKKHPYDNQAVFEIEDILENGNYFISNENNSYTNINGINLEKV